MGLQQNFRDQTVSELEIRQPVVVTAELTVRETVEAMRTADLGCAIVIGADRKPLGLFTESMLTQMLVHGSNFLEEPIERHMTDRCPWVELTDPVADVLEAMQLKNVRFLCVLDDEGRVAGLTGQRGLMEYVAEHFPGEVMVQRVGQPPYLSDREGA